MGNSNTNARHAGAGGTPADGYANSVTSELRAHFGNVNTPFPHQISNHRGPDYQEDGGVTRLTHVDSSESMVQTLSESPGSAARSPLMFSPQTPMVPIPRADETGFYPYPLRNYESQVQDDYQQERGILTIFQWTHGGEEVFVEGSWDHWHTRIRLQKAGNDFTVMKLLPSGLYQYTFVVNGESRHSPDLPFIYDDRGNIRNILDLQEHVPENLDTIAGFEAPRSPNASYDNRFPTLEDFSKEPPIVPPQLHLTLLDVPNNADAQGSLPRPPHVILNHLYVEKGRTTQSLLALGLTNRFRSKYVTVVLYKPIPKKYGC